MTTRSEQLTMSHVGQQAPVLDQGKATHVVTAVLYGAQAFFVFDREASSSDSVEEIQGQMKVMVEKIPKISEDGEHKMDDKEIENAEKITCTFYGDFGLENKPATYQDAIKVCSSLPKVLGDNGEEAVPVTVWLYPLVRQDSRGPQLIREVSAGLISNVQAALEHLTELDMRCNDMAMDKSATTFPELQRKVQRFQALCHQYRQTVQQQLAEIVPSVRGGGAEEGALLDVLSSKERSPFSAQRLSEHLDKKVLEMKLVDSYLTFLSGVDVVSSTNELQQLLLNPSHKYIVSFTFTSLHEEEPYLSVLKAWLQTPHAEKTHEPVSGSSACETLKSSHWFEDKEGHRRARESVNFFSDFARANESNGKTRFTVASVLDKANPGASIYLYEDGERVSTNFQPPPKPLPPSCSGVRHDRVQLTLKPAAYGRAEICGYRAEYRLVGEENWVAVNVSNTQEKLTVTGLRPNTQYQFRYAAVSKPGRSESSDVSDTVKTLPPASPPGKPVGTTVESSAIALTWDSPPVIGDGVSVWANLPVTSLASVEEAAIAMPALGRPFQLGMLYDCRTDSILPGLMLLDSAALRQDVDMKKQDEAGFQVIDSDTIAAKASALQVGEWLQTSFLCGMVEVKGSAEYLRDTRRSRRQARVTLQYKMTTRSEQLTMSHVGQQAPYPAVMDQGKATHVVTAVLYGAQAFFVFDREASSSDTVEEIQGQMKVMVEKIPKISEEDGEPKMDDKKIENAEKITCAFYSDFGLENKPATYQEAIKVCSALSKELGDNGEEAVPVTVWLYPLVRQDSSGPQLIREISVGLISNVQAALEHLTELDMRCNDMAMDKPATTFPELQRKVQQFQALCHRYRQTVQQQLAEIVPSVRDGGAEEGALLDVLSSKERSPFSAQRLSEHLDKKVQEMKLVESYLTSLSGVDVVSSTNELEQLLLDQTHKNVVSFTFTSLHEEEPYLSALEAWLQTSHAEKTHDPASASSACETPKSSHWFEDKEGNTRARDSVNFFSDFARANESNGKTRFIVASVPDKANPGTSIYLYGDGELLSTNFQPPPKPLPLLIGGVKHDHVQLTLKLAAHGRAEICGYRAEYRLVGEENWVTVNVSNTQETLTVTGLHPNTQYQFRYATVSKLGLSESSDVSDTVKTLPTSPPGKSVAVTVESSTITLTWESPRVIGDGVSISEYKVEYKEETGGEQKDKWLERRTKRTKSCTIDGLRSETPYRFRVSAVCADGAVSDPGEEVSITTAVEESKVLVQDLRRKSTRIEEGQPAVCALPIEKGFDSNAEHPKYRLGKETLQIPNKVIMVMGATGSGKTTLINGMINYVLGVQWKDEFRFKLIHETTNRSQAESQTSEVTAYEVNHTKGFQVPYSLTIIDTPGFGDTRGIDHDKEIIRKVQGFFSTPGAIDHIDAVCFVVQASLARLTHAQRYVFDSVLSIFGKDIKDNILILVTFADGQPPPVLEAIKTADVPCAKDAQGNPVYFKFNNSVLFASNAAADEGSCNFDEMFWKMGAMSMQTFFGALSKLETRSLTLTQEVLRERKELEVAVEGLQPQIKAGLVKLEELRKTQEALEQHKGEMEANRDFEYEVEKTVPVKIDITGTGRYITNCQQCHYTCHHPCMISDDNKKRECAAMDSDTGYCQVCPGKCVWNVHFNQKYKWEYTVVKEKQTYSQLKEKYEKASGEVLSTQSVVEKLSQEYAAVEEILVDLIEKSSRSLQRLQEIALKPNPLSTPEYIDLLIMSEQQELKPGYQERIKSLKDVREMAEIVMKIANEEPLLPGDQSLYKKAEEKRGTVKSFFKGAADRVISWFH